MSSPGFGARTPWSAGAAIVFAGIAFAMASGFAVMAGAIYFKLGQWLTGPGNVIASENVTLTNTLMATLVLQAVTLGLALWGAGRFGGDRRQVLSLPQGLPLGQFLTGFGGMVAILAPLNVVSYLLWPADFGQDLRPFAELARSSAMWLPVLVLVIGAPLWEEVLFRGFLLPALTKTRYGFRGAALLTTFAWTVLHLGYTVIGLFEVLIIGFYFCWLMWRYGNLWLTIMLHALYNGLQLAVISIWPNLLTG